MVLIDRDSLEERLKGFSSQETIDKKIRAGIRFACMQIFTVKEINFTTDGKGKWIFDGEYTQKHDTLHEVDLVLSWKVYKCSVCGGRHKLISKYCPSCGALMEE